MRTQNKTGVDAPMLSTTQAEVQTSVRNNWQSGGTKTKINQRYLAGSIAEALQDYRYLGVHSSYGTGKTTAIKIIINELPDNSHVLFIAPRKSLNSAIAGEFSSINCYLDIKAEIDKSAKNIMMHSMSCTPQSLSGFIDKNKDYKYDAVIFDESESIVKMLVSDVTKEKERTLHAMQCVVRSSDRVVFMDADYGKESSLFARQLTGLSDMHVLENDFCPWSKIGADLITGSSSKERKQALNTKIIDAIEKGEKLAITSSSATYCNDIYKVIKNLYPQLTVKLATSATDNQNLVNDPSSIKQVDILIYSPSLSVGVSFDIENHFSRVFAFLANEEGTPDSFDAMQMMCRVRNPSLNSWVIALDDDKKIYGDDDILIPIDIQHAITRRYADNEITANGTANPISDLSHQILQIHCLIEANKRRNKNNYNSEFLRKLSEMGIHVNQIDIDGLGVDMSIKESIDRNKEDEMEEKIQKVFNASKLEDEDYQRLKAQQHYGIEHTSEQRASMERYYLEQSFNVDLDSLGEGDKRDILTFRDSGFISKAVLRAQISATTEFDKLFIKMGLDGIGEDEAGKRDILHKRHNYKLKKKLHKYALAYADCEKEYSHKMLKRTGFYQYILRNKKDINILMPNFVPRNFKAKPAGLMNKLLENQGYKHTSSQDEKSKKREYIYRAMLDASFEKFYKEQEKRGDNWIERTERIFKDLDKNREVLSCDDIERLRIPIVDIRFVAEKLSQIPKIHHAKIMAVFKGKYDIMRHGMQAPKIANLWLENQAKKYNISNLETLEIH